MLRVVGLLALTGCNLVFGVDPPDGPVTPDVPRDVPVSACWNALLTDDEDGDQIDDGCDICPADVDAAGTRSDGDGDGVGDACDVAFAPMLPQHWVIFDGFHDDTNGWRPTAGSWAVTGFSLAVDPGGGRADRMIDATSYPEVRTRILDTSSLVLNANAGIELYAGASLLARCSYQYASGSDLVVLEVPGLPQLSVQFDAGGDVWIQLYQDDNRRFHCDARSAAMKAELRADEIIEFTATKIGIYAVQTAATFPWVGLTGR
ncbi:MAG: hypothetical protein H6Q90_6965 [Deltaproteobacteria bacterium]|nr:hypothetical protein [Deltaproteobacteria bacterium]